MTCILCINDEVMLLANQRASLPVVNTLGRENAEPPLHCDFNYSELILNLLRMNHVCHVYSHTPLCLTDEVMSLANHKASLPLVNTAGSENAEPALHCNFHHPF